MKFAIPDAQITALERASRSRKVLPIHTTDAHAPVKAQLPYR